MKKLYLALLALILLTVQVYAGDESGTDLFSTGGSHQFRIMSDGSPVSDGGIINQTEIWLAPIAISSFAYLNYAGVSTTTLLSGTTAFTSALVGFTQPDYPRNIGVGLWYNGQSSTSNIRCTFTLSGKDARGEDLYETIAGSATAVTYGVKAFSSIQSFSLSGATNTCKDGESSTTITPGETNTMNICLGCGDVMGLSADIQSSSDVYKVIENKLNVSTASVSINVANDTIDFVSASNATINFIVKYLFKKR